MRVLVCGGRNFHDRAAVFKALDRLHAKRSITLIIHGAAQGADTAANDWALQHGVDRRPFPANWLKYGKEMAGAVRNQQMLAEGKPEAVVAFPGARGTRDMIQRAEAEGLTVWQPMARYGVGARDLDSERLT